MSFPTVKLGKQDISTNESSCRMLAAWQQEAVKLESGEMTKRKCDRWRYRDPKFDMTQKWVKVLPQELSDALVEELNK